jgi:intein/homing endonuclease
MTDTNTPAHSDVDERLTSGLVGDTLVTMADGSKVALANLAPGSQPGEIRHIDIEILNASTFQTVKAHTIVHAQPAPIYVVNTSTGYIIAGAGEHEIMIAVDSNGGDEQIALKWRNLDGLRPGDRIIVDPISEDGKLAIQLTTVNSVNIEYISSTYALLLEGEDAAYSSNGMLSKSATSVVAEA